MSTENGKIYPPGLGRRIRPPTKDWPVGTGIGNMPSVAGIITDRTLLPQVLRGEVRPIGKAGEWLQFFRGSLANRPSVHEVSHFSQGIRQRVVDRVNTVKGRALAYRAQDSAVPPPWGPRTWPITQSLANMPSVMGIGFRNTRTMHPQLNKGEMKGSNGLWIAVEQDTAPSHAALGQNFSVMVE